MPKKAIISVLIHCKVKSKAKPWSKVLAVTKEPSFLKSWLPFRGAVAKSD